eukprot:snap_masked-scaffold43_size480169-processed-gene-3.15 protein:Tk12738 transcript:snap_masked-scaffold43_size480169-processed-gene-3.15-mRNA-1 annotation:"hypothetical protein SINV_14612"
MEEAKCKDILKHTLRGMLKTLALLSSLYLFICSLTFLSNSFRILGGKNLSGFFSSSELLSNPIVGVMIGIVVTALVQSSATSTSIIVSLVSAGVSVPHAIPMIFGSNVGTSITNTIVSITQASDRECFKRAFAAATVHDMFNWLSVIILLAIELPTRFMEISTGYLVDQMPLGSDIQSPDLLKPLTRPFTDSVVQLDSKVLLGWSFEDPKYNNVTTLLKTNCTDVPCPFLLAYLGEEGVDLSDSILGLLLLAFSLLLLCMCLMVLMKVLNSMLGAKMAEVIQSTINADIPYCPWLTGYIAMLIGAIVTILVRSSSVFTSTLTPLCGAGLVTLETVYPLTLGSNIGTTTTSILASLAAEGKFLKPSVQIALVHLMFNLIGILIFYPIPFMRFPIGMARKLGEITAQYRWFAGLYLILMFFVVPVLVFALSLAGLSILYMVLGVLLLIGLGILGVNVLQTKQPHLLPMFLRNWDFLPLCFRSLQPVDDLISKLSWSKTPKDIGPTEEEGVAENGEAHQLLEKPHSETQPRVVYSCRVVLSDVPSKTSRSEVETLVAKFGNLLSLEESSTARNLQSNPEPSPEGDNNDEETANNNGRTFTAVFQTREEAEKAVDELNSTEIGGEKVRANLIERRPFRRTNGGPNNGFGGMLGVGGLGMGQRQIDFPLRILVESEMVGAIIGRGGQTIRHITQQTRARVDVHRKDNLGATEKAITIYGQPENCSKACKEIMKVMREEARNLGKTEETNLKILAHNNLIGRIIGKQGGTIKKIMEDTNTKIAVSSINEINTFNLERIITIAGEVEDIFAAESEISSKLRAAYEHDIQAMTPQSMMFPGLHPAAMMSTAATMPTAPIQPAAPAYGLGHGHHPHHIQGSGPGHHHAPGGVGGFQGSGVPGMNRNQQFQSGPTRGPGLGGVASMPRSNGFELMGGSPAHFQTPNASQSETTYLSVPNSSVGAIIGSKGSHIRNIIKFSGALVKIAQQPDCPGAPDQSVVEDGVGDVSASPTTHVNSGNINNNVDERRITVVGNPESQWKAQFLIFDKIREENFNRGSLDEIRLRVEILVPSNQVGRIIGKGGTNVRELQRITGAEIKLPEQGSSSGEETPVHLTGVFFSVQSAQRRLRAMITSVNQHEHQSHHPRPVVHQQQLSVSPLNGRVEGAVEGFSEC